MQLTIQAEIKTATGIHSLSLPMNEQDFDKALTKAGILTCTGGEYAIESIESENTDIDGIIPLSNDIEELNYLAQRLDSFSGSELETYAALVNAHNLPLTMQKLINLTFNINDFNIEQGIHDLEELGERFVKNEAPNLHPTIFENINFESIGEEVQTDDLGVFTDVGYCCDFNQGFEQIYDGKFFPKYDYETDYDLKIKLSASDDSTGRGVYITLPAFDEAFGRAMNRLGVTGLDECKISDFQSWRYEKLESVFSEHEDIEKLNRLAETLGNVPEMKIREFQEKLHADYSLDSIDSLMMFTQSIINSEQNQVKPDCPLVGADGNIFSLMGIAARTLKENNLPDQAKEMCNKIISSSCYNEALNIISDYVNITEQEQAYDGQQMNM